MAITYGVVRARHGFVLEINKMSKETTNVVRLTYSVQEVAAAIGVSSRTVHSLIKGGSLPHVRIGARVLVPAEALKTFIEQRTQQKS